MKKDLNYIAALEKAIAKKYGKEAIINPKSNWTEEKEKEYLEQRTELIKREQKTNEKTEKLEKDGFFIPRHLINKTNKRDCPICETYSFNSRDDVYMNKYECCHDCYIQWVENREERWVKGWRPNSETNQIKT